MTAPTTLRPDVAPEGQEPVKRGWRATTQVALVLIGVSLFSVILVGLFNFFSARDLLNSTIEEQLLDIATARASRIGTGLEALQESVATMAADQGVKEALADLSAGYGVLEPLSASQEAELVRAYEAGIAEEAPPGVQPPPVADLLPGSDQADYLQYHYIVQNPFDAGERANLDDAGDGSQWSEAHAIHHPTLRAMTDSVQVGDAILIDGATSSVVYTVDKRAELGTNLSTGPHRESGLAEAVLDQLWTAAADEAVVVDFEPYAPARLAPVLFVAAAIREQGEVVGALAVEVPNESLTSVITADQSWQETGLGNTGEIYVVGPDRTMRSDSRLFLENPGAYLEAVSDPAVATAARAFETTVLIQPVETEGVEVASGGDLFIDRSTNYLDEATLTVAFRFDTAGLEWVVVAEITEAEAYGPIRRHIGTIIVLAIILIPVVAVFGYFLARRVLRPVHPITAAAAAVSDGNLEVELPVSSRDEFGDLSANFNGLVEALREQRGALEQADAETAELLRAVLPPRLADKVKEGESDIAEAVRNATLIAISVEETESDDPIAQYERRDHGVEFSAAIAALAATHEVEQIRSSASRGVYATGLRSADAEIGRAIEFVLAARDLVTSMADHNALTVAFRAGVAAGDVLTGIVGTERITFDVWGEPSRIANALVMTAHPGQILIDAAVAGAADGRKVAPVSGLVDLSGNPLEAWSLSASGFAGSDLY